MAELEQEIITLTITRTEAAFLLGIVAGARMAWKGLGQPEGLNLKVLADKIERQMKK
jgi:sulfopyruvate decarboxylase TPP-binding subunit